MRALVYANSHSNDTQDGAQLFKMISKTSFQEIGINEVTKGHTVSVPAIAHSASNSFPQGLLPSGSRFSSSPSSAPHSSASRRYSTATVAKYAQKGNCRNGVHDEAAGHHSATTGVTPCGRSSRYPMRRSRSTLPASRTDENETVVKEVGMMDQARRQSVAKPAWARKKAPTLYGNGRVSDHAM